MTRHSLAAAILCAAVVIPGAASAENLRLMTGPQGGSWYPMGGAIKNVVEAELPGTTLQVMPGAGIANVKAIEAGKADVVLSEKVDRINGHISDLQTQLADVASRAAALSLGVGRGEAAEVQAAARFAEERGLTDMSVEDYRAYRSALNTYMRRGAATPADVRAQMSVGSDPDGGRGLQNAPGPGVFEQTVGGGNGGVGFPGTGGSLY
jgi:hypothetical protein